MWRNEIVLWCRQEVWRVNLHTLEPDGFSVQERFCRLKIKRRKDDQDSSLRDIWRYADHKQHCSAGDASVYNPITFYVILHFLDYVININLFGRSRWVRFSRIGCWGGYWSYEGRRSGAIGEDYITRSFMLCTCPHQISFGWPNQEDWDGQGM